MEVMLRTQAELQAAKAQSLPAFSGINLLHIKKTVTELLSLIGRDGIFDQYTRHDVSHIDGMLEMLDWLVPAQTQAIMTPADWLMTVLSIYFHDLGMLVTKHEFVHRGHSGFAQFKESLFQGPEGIDYRAKVEKMSHDDAERFLYQEFVRHNHAQRVKNWIMGEPSRHLGVASETVDQVSGLLREADSLFRKDLALVCESHHRDDLHETGKYKLCQPYGSRDSETANLQYCAILLRTADLLHITRDRTPSVMFKLITPTDLISLREWAKQMAVRRVKPATPTNKDGLPDENLPKDTVEVYAHFTSEDGYFGLTHYLEYVERQLRQTQKWAEGSTKHGSKHRFPWKYVSYDQIETEGFLKETFRFELDHTKILTLLTGHTLYNNVKVAVRELVQNALDATRLQRLIAQQTGEAYCPKILVHWDSKSRALTVTDNGTGISQATIKEHLLRVGASQYQDDTFRKRYPEFSAISRFGIGILSTFMVSDSVDILTAHPEDEVGRQLSLRSVHGSYLIRLHPRSPEGALRSILPHGTTVRLSIRPSIDLVDVLTEVQKWVVVPEAELIVQVDEQPGVRVGHESPREAIENWLMVKSHKNFRRVKVEQLELDGVTLAYAVVWSESFREWEFMPTPDRHEDDKEPLPVGLCLEGVRVEFSTPGFNGVGLLALANLKGHGAPRTNVARSGLEVTPELDAALAIVYALYCRHVNTEWHALWKDRGFSLTWATHEARHLLSPLLVRTRERAGQSFAASNESLLDKSAATVPTLLVEHRGEREAMSVETVTSLPAFWTIDSQFTRFAEQLVKEATSPASLSSVARVVHGVEFPIPEEELLCGFVSTYDLHRSVIGRREVDSIRLYRDQRRVDLRWVAMAQPPRWIRFPAILRRQLAAQRMMELALVVFGGEVGLTLKETLRIGVHGITLEGLNEEIAIRAVGGVYLRPDTHIAKKLAQLVDSTTANPSPESAVALYAAFSVVGVLLSSSFGSTQPWGHLRGRGNWKEVAKRIGEYTDFEDFERVLHETQWVVFDPSVWNRPEGEVKG